MAGIVPVGSSVLARRRKKLRQKRRLKIFQTLWQTLSVSCLAGGLLWVTLQPIWVLKNPKDIAVLGNHLFSDDAIRSLLGLSYPQSLWRIEPSRVAHSLEKQPIIAQAKVTRRLFPPGLILQVQERVPVAVAQTRPEQINTNGTNKKVSVGLLDANGVWIPLEKFTSLHAKIKLPSLKVIGLPQLYRPYWSEVYKAVSQSTVKVMEIDWQDPTNLILKTEIGKVHLGVPNSQLSEQIKLLAQIRHLPSQINPSQIEYIDLKNPDHPLVQMIPKTGEISSKIP